MAVLQPTKRVGQRFHLLLLAEDQLAAMTSRNALEVGITTAAKISTAIRRKRSGRSAWLDVERRFDEPSCPRIRLHL
jgi:hypothetical protein